MFNIIYATISFLSFGLVLLIFPWFIRFRSIPGLFACVWLLVVNFIFGLNAAAFTGDVLLRAPVYCDVVTKLLVGMQMAVPTAMLCYTFSIHDWLVRPKWRDLNDKFFVFRERFHVALCILMPIMYMALRE
ncbi:uncharacterized protein FOMMEDRAFT_80248 [Fomitiporia mediterranea MF3/22]|uniref:uncharacterized protein n=1 Tax=Fomitiporia mediterranea (strain MF3/22) TaxID=694068 RepID=UPI0004408624|nr:uncharacterized protein FOMMEDRAFT_80248 [Fomitiporia mediterranea MF3/22]EJD05038.1 hypothetical protein FOMMEDRAFT_80248 [Fomitiporia mediterranea MF3/22]